MAFDPLYFGYVNPASAYLYQKYPKRFVLIGGNLGDSVDYLSTFFGQKRFDMVYIDSGSYPKTAGMDFRTFM